MDAVLKIRYEPFGMIHDVSLASPETFDPQMDILEEVLAYSRQLSKGLPVWLEARLRWKPDAVVADINQLDPVLTGVAMDIELEIPVLVKSVPAHELGNQFYWFCRLALNQTGYLRWLISTQVKVV